MDGKTAMSRYPKGFLLVDKPAGWCWIYEWVGGRFVVRTAAGEPVLTEGVKNRYRAAAEPNYDVVAAPWVGDPDVPSPWAGDDR